MQTLDDSLGAKKGQQSTDVLQQEDIRSTHADSHILLASSSKDCMTVVLQGIFTGRDRTGQVLVCMA